MTQDTPQHDQNTTETLIASLEKAEIPFELDDQGKVKATPEVVEFLESKEALVGEQPKVFTKDELLFPELEDDRTDEEKGYEFRQLEADEVEKEIKAGNLTTGSSDLKAKSDRHQNIEVYIGPIPELQGQPCLVKRNPKDPYGVAVQFDDKGLVFNDKALGYGWHDFPAQHISDTRPFLDKWRDLPSAARSGVRKAKKIPRIHPSGERFLTPKENRRGVAGAFGGPTAKRKRLELARQNAGKKFLLNVITEGDAPNKTIAVRASNVDEAKGGAFLRHHQEFPGVRIEDIEVHNESAAA